jgi:flagellar biogenesis protein FliO
VSPAAEYMLNTSLTLAGIVLLAWLLIYVSRRWERNAPRGPLELLGTLRLENRRAVYLVRVAERVVALGASEGGMIKVLELTDSEMNLKATPPEKFGTLLRRIQGKTNVAPSDADVSSQAAGNEVRASDPPAKEGSA